MKEKERRIERGRGAIVAADASREKGRGGGGGTSGSGAPAAAGSQGSRRPARAPPLSRGPPCLSSRMRKAYVNHSVLTASYDSALTAS